MSVLATAAKIISAARTTFEVIKAAIEAGKDVTKLVDAALNLFKKDEITVDDLALMRTRIDELRAELHLPLPEPEEGEEA